MNWQTFDLSDLISKMESGSRPHGGVSEKSGEIPSVGGENIRQSGGLDLTEVRKVPISFFKLMTKGVLKNGDVLINKDGANTGKVGLYQGQFRDASINEHVFLIRADSQNLDQKYLYYILRSQSGQDIIRSKITGSAQPGLKRDFIKNFSVNIPKSLNEQLKIVEVLSNIDNDIDQTELLIIKHQQILTGLMQDLLNRGIDKNGQLRTPVTHQFKQSPVGVIPKDWEVLSLASITKRDSPICYGIVQPRNYFAGGIPVIAIKDMKGDYQTDIHLTNPDIDAKYTRSRIEPGDLLISVKGTIGVIDLVPNNFQGNISRDIARVRFTNKQIPSFYMFYLESFQGQKSLDLISVGTTRKELSIAPLKELLVPVPEKEEQEKIAKILNENKLHIAYLQNELHKLKGIKLGLMQDLLSGKVPVTLFGI